VDAHFIPGVPIRFCPGVRGGTEWNGPAYHPGLNLVFTGAVDRCTILTQIDPDSLGGAPGQPWAGGIPPDIFGSDEDSTNWRGWITAFDADSGTTRWKHETVLPNISGITPTAGGLLFVGELTGDVVAFDAGTGAVLWRHPTHNGIGGGVITYAVGGKQFVAVAAGIKSHSWPAPMQSNRIIVFALP
jgi:alcohol dehydrogenase (cytochrome c)